MKIKKLFSKLSITAFTLLIMLPTVVLSSSAADDTILFDLDNSWFFAQNENPHGGSYCTAAYFDGSVFKKMEAYEENTGWKTENGKAFIETWRVHLTKDYSPAIEFNTFCDTQAAKAGYLEITDSGAEPMRTDGTAAELIIVQKDADGKYYPIYPNPGVWEWKTLKDTATDIGTVRTYLSLTDKVYVVYRTDSETTGIVETMPKFKYVESSQDTEALRASYEFTEWKNTDISSGNEDQDDENQVFDSPIGWYVTQAVQPWEGSYYTFEYYNEKTGKFEKLEKYHSESNPAFWGDAADIVNIKGWEMTAGYSLYAALAFNPNANGRVVLTNNKSITGAAEDGQFMLIQCSEGKYCPLTEWIDVPKDGTVKLPDVITFVKKNDIVYYLFRSKTEIVSVAKFENPGVIYTKAAEDTENLYPTVWKNLDEIFVRVQSENLPVKLDSGSNATKATENDVKIPQTGDNENIEVLIVVLLFSLSAVAFSLRKLSAN